MNRKIKVKNLVSSFVLGVILILGLLVLLNDIDGIRSVNTSVIVTFLINGLIIFISLSLPFSSPYRLKDVVDVFMFIFMFIAPLVQYLRNSFPWWDTSLITDEKIIYVNIIVFLFLMLFNLAYLLSKKTVQSKSHKYNINNINLILDILWFMTIIVSAFLISKVGFFNLFARSTNKINIENQSLNLFVTHSLRSTPVIYVALSILNYQKDGSFYKLPKFIIGTVLMILVNFPTATARYWMAAVYIGLMVIILRKMKNSSFLKALLLLGMLIVFPFVNIFRNLNVSEAINQGVNFLPLTDAFLSGDFDSFSMLIRAIIVVEKRGIFWGYQLLGSLFFFIPRSIWSTKPVGSGYTVGKILNWNFTNVSMPLIGEFYINFGQLGVIVLAILFGIVLKKLDSSYFQHINDNNAHISFIEIVFPFTIGFLFFMMRGDLLSSWGYYVGFMMPLFMVYFLNRVLK